MRMHKKAPLDVVLHKKSPYGKRLKSATIATSTPIVSITLRFISESLAFEIYTHSIQRESRLPSMYDMEDYVLCISQSN